MSDVWTESELAAAKAGADRLVEVFNPAAHAAGKVIEAQATEIDRLRADLAAAYDRATADAVAWLRSVAAAKRAEAEEKWTFTEHDDCLDTAHTLDYAADALERREHVGAATSDRR